MNYKTFDIFEGKKKKIDYDTPRNLLPDSFCGLIVGKPGSGKSHLLKLMLHNPHALYQKFDLVLFIAPYEIGGLDLKEDRKHSSLSVDWIRETINKERAKGRRINKVCVFIDDMISSINKDGNNAEIIDLMFNRRKMFRSEEDPDEECEVSLLITTQKYTMFPAKFRSSLQFIIFFHIPANDYETLAKDQLYGNQTSLKQIFKAHFATYPHNFVYTRLDTSQIFLNFDKQL